MECYRNDHTKFNLYDDNANEVLLFHNFIVSELILKQFGTNFQSSVLL
jgi:hypothetical protein